MTAEEKIQEAVRIMEIMFQRFHGNKSTTILMASFDEWRENLLKEFMEQAAAFVKENKDE